MDSIGQTASPNSAPDAPRGVFRVPVDDKGRLKLPAAILQYLESLREDRKVFITTFDEAEARIYPISSWKETEKILQEPGDDFDDRDALALVAANYGQDADVDTQGRVTLPGELRKKLGLEGDEVRLHCFKGRINLYGSAEYGQRFTSATTDLRGRQSALRKRGL